MLFRLKVDSRKDFLEPENSKLTSLYYDFDLVLIDHLRPGLRKEKHLWLITLTGQEASVIQLGLFCQPRLDILTLKP